MDPNRKNICVVVAFILVLVFVGRFYNVKEGYVEEFLGKNHVEETEKSSIGKVLSTSKVGENFDKLPSAKPVEQGLGQATAKTSLLSKTYAKKAYSAIAYVGGFMAVIICIYLVAPRLDPSPAPGPELPTGIAAPGNKSSEERPPDGEKKKVMIAATSLYIAGLVLGLSAIGCVFLVATPLAVYLGLKKEISGSFSQRFVIFFGVQKYDNDAAYQPRVISLLMLSVLRLACVGVIVSALGVNLSKLYQSDHLSRFPFYLTHLVNLGTVLYLLTTGVSGLYSLVAPASTPGNKSTAVKWLEHHLYSTMCIMQPIVAVAFWTVLNGYRHIGDLQNNPLPFVKELVLHGFPLLVLLMEFKLTKRKYFGKRTWIVSLLVLLAYGGWLFVGAGLHLTGSRKGTPWVPYRILYSLEGVLIVAFGCVVAVRVTGHLMHTWHKQKAGIV